MHLQTWAEISLLIFGGLFSIITVSFFGVIAFALTKLVKLLDTATNKMDPLIVKASDTIDTVNRVTRNVGEKADSILTKSEAVTDNVSDRVEKTANVVQSAVTGPLINLSSVLTGVTKGLSVYSHSSSDDGTSNGNGTRKL